MCHPLAIAAGIATGVGGTMSAVAKHNAAKKAAARQNMINELSYKQQMQQKAPADQIKAKSYARELAAQAAAVSALHKQQELNQLERTRASVVAQQALQETVTESAFESQQKLIAQIQAQGTVLAGEQQSGQSLLLSLMETDRALGLQEAQLTASLEDANKAYRFQEYGFDLDKYGADASAMNRLPGAPVAESASFAAMKMPTVEGPSGLDLLGGIISSAGAGIGVGYGVQAAGAQAGIASFQPQPTPTE